MSPSLSMSVDSESIIREGWNALVTSLGLQRATLFVVLLERGKGDSIEEIASYWGNAGIEEIHNRVVAWKLKTSTTENGWREA
ncbi:MAG: hypothetical protein AB1791_03935 [Chloroflexota bacterium]